MTTDRAGDRPAPSGDQPLNVHWDDSNMRSAYSNVCNVTGTREEVVLLFGVHKAWHGGVKDVTVELQNRVILNPFAAKRLHMLLGRLLREYESRYGALPVEAAGPGVAPEKLPTGG
jgi:hypothetical protein